MMYRIVNMEHEMYNDGLYFNEKALIQSNFGDKQRCERFAIVSFASSFEAFINSRLKSKLSEDPTAVPNGSDILKYLVNGFSNGGRIPNELLSIKSKIRLLEQLYGITNQLVKSSNFATFNSEVILLRNSIVHYSHGNFSNVYSSQITLSANNAAGLLRMLIQTFTSILGIEYPSYYNEVKYKPIL